MSSSSATGTSVDTASDGKSGVDRSGVRFDKAGATVVVTLDRPAKLNAIDSAMKVAIASQIRKIARDPQVYAVLLRATPGKMFSAGGDIREFYDLARADPVLAAQECEREYSLIWLLDCFSKPTVALVDGAVLGTGAGIVMTATHRVAGPGYRFQMPETLIGFFPDNGVCYHLARLPHEIGTWLGLTGSSIGREDALKLRLVTHCLDTASFADAAAAIADAQPIDEVLGALHRDPGAGPLERLGGVIERCFGADTVAEIMQRLSAEPNEREWCENARKTLASRSPLALEITLRHLRISRHLDLRQVLMLDYRLAVQMVTSHDFFEGVKERIIEKTGRPRWRPAVSSDLGREEIIRIFNVVGIEMYLPTRPEMQALRV